MEKKSEKKPANKTKKLTTKKKTVKEKKVNNATKKKRGFTLIELLAVIIILGILMIIAIPSVSSYISDSRKSAYVDTAKQLISSARNYVNEGTARMHDKTATYYVPASCLNVENGGPAKSPYGEFVNAYVAVTYEETGFKYYWKSIDDAGMGIKELVEFNDLDEDLIDSDLKAEDVSYNEKVEGKDHVVLIDSKDCYTQLIVPEEVTTENGPTTTDHITWIYRDLSLAVDAHLENCSIQGNYRMCYGVSINVQSLESDSVIRTFVASFDVPEGTELIQGAYDPNKAIVELDGTKLTITGNPSGGAQNYISTSGIGTGFQIKIPKSEDVLLLSAQIEYDLVSGDTQEGTSSGGQGTLANMDGQTSNNNLRVVLNRFNSWQNGGSNVTTMQYHVEVTNLTDHELSNWSFTLEAPDSIQNIYTYSGLQATKNGNTYVFTPYSYSPYKTLASNQTAPFNNCLVIETTNSSETPIIK